MEVCVVEKAYDGLQQLSSVDFELCSGINDHFPQNAEYHVMMFLKCAAMFEFIGTKTQFQETILNNESLENAPKEANCIQNLVVVL